MENVVLHVAGMSCEHCAKAVTNTVNALPGVAGVVVDLTAKTVTMDYDPSRSSLDKIKAGIEEQGYELVN